MSSEDPMLQSRRSFLKTISGAGGLLWFGPSLGGDRWVDGYNKHEFCIQRPTDLLNLKVYLLNYQRDRKLPNDFTPRFTGPPLLILEFPPQNIAEAIFDLEPSKEYETQPLDFNKTAKSYSSRPRIPHFSSGPSWLVFVMENDDRISLTDLSNLFSTLENRPLKVPPGANASARGVSPAPPKFDETRLEIPFRLFIAPESNTRVKFQLHTGYKIAPIQYPWQAKPIELEMGSVAGVTNSDNSIIIPSTATYLPGAPLGTPQFALWDAELIGRKKLEPAKSSLPSYAAKELQAPSEVSARARAIYSPDYRRNTEPPSNLYYPAERQLSALALTRHLLTSQMGEGDGWIDVVHLMLTSIGANAHLHYESQKEINSIIEKQIANEDQEGLSSTNLRLFKQKITIGRDNCIVEAFLGFLFPFLIPAIYVSVTNRQRAAFFTDSDKTISPTGSYLLKKRYILTLKPSKQFCDNSSPFGRDCPTKHVELLTLQSPNLEAHKNVSDPDADDLGAKPIEKGFFFWPKTKSGQADVNWEHEITDASGKKLRSTTSKMLFASNIAKGHKIYNAQTNDDRTQHYAPGKFSLTDEKNPTDASAPNEEPKGSNVEIHSIRFRSNHLHNELKKADILAALGDRVNLAELEDPADLEGPDYKRLELWLSFQESGESADLPSYLKSLANARTHAKQIDSPYFHPSLDISEIIIPALKDGSQNVPVRSIEYIPGYVSGGFEELQNGSKISNRTVENEAFAQLLEVIGKDGSLGETIQTGIAQPAVIIAGLSREYGAIVASGKKQLEDFISRTKDFNLEDAIPDMMILGAIPLKALLGPLTKGELPSIESLELPDTIDKKWNWSTRLKEKKITSFLTFKVSTDLDQSPALIFDSSISIDLKKIKQDNDISSAPPTNIKLNAHLGWATSIQTDDKQKWIPSKNPPKKFPIAVNLLNLVEVRLTHFKFNADYQSGQPFDPTVDPKIEKIALLGPLKFVAKVQEFIEKIIGKQGSQKLDRNAVYPNTNQDSSTALTTEGKEESPFDLKVDAKGIRASYDFELPPISFGAFSITNVRLASSLQLPFIGAMRFRFALSSFKKPFGLSVMGYAGRGFLAFAMDTAGNRELEGALEFGGALSFNIAVARGNLYIMGGAYFKITNNSTQLDGYVRAGGSLRVIGMINVNAEFLLCVSYRKTNSGSELYGTCTLVVNIDLGFWDKDVSIRMKKRIKGSDDANSQKSLSSSPPVGPWLSYSDRTDKVKSQGKYKNAADYYNNHLQYLSF